MKLLRDKIFLSIVVAFLISALAGGCGGSSLQVSRPNNGEGFDNYVNSTVMMVELSLSGKVLGPNCTAFFVSPRLLGTAAHCVVDRGTIVEVAPGVLRRVRLDEPEPTVGRTILFMDYNEENKYMAMNREEREGYGEPQYYSSTVVAVDEDNDVAVLELEDSENDWPVWHELRSLVEEPLQAGEKVFSVSNPVGIPYVFSSGIVSRFLMTGERTVILHQVRLGPGSSGSALLDSNGRVVGINVSLSRGGFVTSATPVSYLKTQIEIAKTNREIERMDGAANVSN